MSGPSMATPATRTVTAPARPFRAWRRTLTTAARYTQRLPAADQCQAGRINSALGIRGELSTWAVDLSVSYGRNELTLHARNSINSTYGAASPTNCYDGKLIYDQILGGLDVSKKFDLPTATRSTSPGASSTATRASRSAKARPRASRGARWAATPRWAAARKGSRASRLPTRSAATATTSAATSTSRRNWASCCSAWPRAARATPTSARPAPASSPPATTCPTASHCAVPCRPASAHPRCSNSTTR